jgi:hypothetical protein
MHITTAYEMMFVQISVAKQRTNAIYQHCNCQSGSMAPKTRELKSIIPFRFLLAGKVTPALRGRGRGSRSAMALQWPEGVTVETSKGRN